MANLQTDIDLFINRAQQKIGALGEEMRDLDSTSGVDVVWQISLIKELKAAIYLFQNNTISENFAYKIIHYLSKKADLHVIPLAVFDDTVLVQNVLLPTGGFTTGPQGPQGDAATISIGTTTTIAYTLPAAVTNSGNTKAAIFNFAIPQGTPGTNGTNGDTGWSAVYSIVNDGARRVLEVVAWIGGTGTPPTPINVYLGTTGYVSDITLAVDIRGIPGIDGTVGNDGNNGWSPIYAIVNDSTRRVLQIIGWTGGSGSAPATGGYIYSGGQTADISVATDIRGPQGLQGDPFTINARGNLSDRNLYDNQGTGYTFLAEDTGDVYIKNSPISGDWSPPISFVGEKGWSPLFNTVEDGQRRLIQLSDWVGGAGLPPDNQGYLYPGGFTLNVSDATDFRGDRGEFFIDASGPLSDRSTYNSQLRPFAYFANDNGNIYLKNSNTPADWTTGFQFTGSRGPAGPVGSAGTGGVDAFTVTTSNFTVPAINSNVNVDVLQDSWMAIGQIVFIESAGYYQVVTPISGTTVTLKNIGVSTNAVPTTIITFGKKVSPSGVAGMSPSITASNGLTLTGTNIELGGTLISDTAIDGAFNLLLGSNTPLSIFESLTTSSNFLRTTSGNDQSTISTAPTQAFIQYQGLVSNHQVTSSVDDTSVFLQWTDQSFINSSLIIDSAGVAINTVVGGSNVYFRTDGVSGTQTLHLPNTSGYVLVSGGTNTLSADTTIDGNYNFSIGLITPLQSVNLLSAVGLTQASLGLTGSGASLGILNIGSGAQTYVNVLDGAATVNWTDNSTAASSISVDGTGVGIGAANSITPFYAYLKTSNLTANKIFQFPNIAGNIVIDVATQTLTNKILTSPVINVTSDATGDTYYRNSGVFTRLGIGSTNQVLTVIAGIPSWQTPTTGTVTSVSGTTNRITSTGGSTPVIDISATFEALLGKVATPLSQFASTTSAQLAGIISDETGSGSLVFATSPTLITPLLGTPTSGVLTNCTGTASGLTAGNVTTNANLTGDVTSIGNAATVVKINGTSLSGLSTGILKNTTSTGVPSIAIAADFPTLNQNTSGNAATVTTNANLTGVITSVGNATSIASQTGTGTKFVVDTSPTLVTPVLGVATATTLNRVTITTPATSATLTIADGSSLITSGAFGITFTATGTTNVTLPTSGTLVGGTGTSGQISYWNGTNSQTGNASLVYDATNVFVGIGGTPAAKFHLSGNISAAAWTTNGIGIRDQAATYTDTTSATGTVAVMYGNYYGVKTFNSTSASVIVTNLYGNFFEAPLVTGNLIATNIYVFRANGITSFNGTLNITTGNINAATGGTFNVGTIDLNTLALRTNTVARLSISSFGLQTSTQDALASGTSAFVTYTQANHTGGAFAGFLWTAGTLTNQTTATNITDINFNLGAVMKVVDGTTALMQGVAIKGRTYTPQTTALTITNASVLDVTQSIAGSGTTITSNYAQRWLFDASNYMGLTIASNGGASMFCVGGGNFQFNNFVAMGSGWGNNGGSNSSDFSVKGNGSTSFSSSQSELLFSGAGTIQARAWMRGVTAMLPTANQSYSSFIVGTQVATIAGTGTHALFANMVINPVSVTAGAGALTNSATLYINGAASGATNNYSLWVASGVTRLDGDLKLSTAGNGLYIKQGTNATCGRGTLVGGTLVVSTTKATSTCEIFLTDRGGTVTNLGTIYISAVSSGTSFTVTSSNILDVSTFSWFIVESA